MFLSLGERKVFILSKVSKIEFLVTNFMHVNSKSEGGGHKGRFDCIDNE